MADESNGQANGHIHARVEHRPRRAPTSRPRPPARGDEQAGVELKLGEFEGVDTLTLSEASLVINALVSKRRNDRKGFQESEILTKTVDYLDAFARFKQKENVEAVERLLSSHKMLNKFERAQIGMPRLNFGIGGDRVEMCLLFFCLNMSADA